MSALPTPVDPGQAVQGLQTQLAATPRGSRPAQHATLQYRLGMALAELPTGDRNLNLSTAVRHYEHAAALFRPGAAPREHARVQNARGAALRELGLLPQAVSACRVAVDLMETESAAWEQAAALNNLGLALSDLGRHEEATMALQRAVDAFDSVSRDDEHESEDTEPQRIMARHNLGQVLAEAGRHESATAVYRDTVAGVDQQLHPYQWGLLHHALGVSLTASDEPTQASAAFHAALQVFSRTRHPFQHALAKNNLGLAWAQVGDVTALRRAVTAFNDSLAVLDTRVHRDLWQQAYKNLELAEQALIEQGYDQTRTQHFVILVATVDSVEQAELMRDRLMRLLALPEPRRGEALTEMDLATLLLGESDAVAVTIAVLAVLLELPDEQLVLGLRSRLTAIGTLQDEAALDDAASILEQAISGGMLAPQRIRLRDRLEEMGYHRR